MRDTETTKEIAKTTGKALDASRELGRFLNSIFGDGFRFLGDSFADWASYFRYKNLLAIRDKVAVIREQRGSNAGEDSLLPVRLAIPIIDAASREDDASLQSMWASLLVNGTDSDKKIAVSKIFIDILGSMDPLDAEILRFLGNQELDEEFNFINGRSLNVEEIATRMSTDIKDMRLSLQNLFRLGCIIDSWPETLGNLDIGYSGFRVDNQRSNFRLSDLGNQLLVACSS